MNREINKFDIRMILKRSDRGHWKWDSLVNERETLVAPANRWFSHKQTYLNLIYNPL